MNQQPARRLAPVAALVAAPSGPQAGRAVLGLVLAASVGVLVGGVAGAICAVGVAVPALRWLSVAAGEPERRRRLRVDADLPLLLELVAAVAAAGAEPLAAVAAVRGTMPGDAADALAAAVARCTRRAGPPDVAAPGGSAAPLTAVLRRQPHASPACAAAEQAAACLQRGSGSGSAVAAELRALAQDVRRDSAGRAVVAARRAGVMVAGPLGACFLPAFVAVAVVPVVVTLSGSVAR